MFFELVFAWFIGRWPLKDYNQQRCIFACTYFTLINRLNLQLAESCRGQLPTDNEQLIWMGSKSPYRIGRRASHFADISFHISVILTTGNCQNATGRSAGQIHKSWKIFDFSTFMFMIDRSLTWKTLETAIITRFWLLSLCIPTAKRKKQRETAGKTFHPSMKGELGMSCQ